MKHELLVPVGDKKCLIAAINGGADAVYLGGKKYGARAFSENFTIDEIKEATELCHLYGVKIFITINTVIFDSEINDALDYIGKLYNIGVDALIMQDLGLITLTRKKYPNLEVHASTQMHNYNKKTIEYLETLGIKRVVFARELSLDEINNIKTSMDKEAFIHGSLCISYSGQCLFSSFILGRSGNRGECAGMCRLPYKLLCEGKEVNANGEYLLSPKDLCSIDNFEKLLKSNILSFKIEGRMKSSLYVKTVTKIYRTLIDQYENGQKLSVKEEDLFLLKSVFNREYTSGFLFKDNNIMNIKKPNHQGICIGKVTNVTKEMLEITLSHDINQFDGIRFEKANKGLILNFIYDHKGNLINGNKSGNKIYLKLIDGVKYNDAVMLTNPNLKEDDIVTKKIKIDVEIEAFINNKFKCTIKDDINNVICLEEDLIETADNNPIEKDRIIKTFSKIGDTPFEINSINIDMDNNIFIPMSKLNEFRRKIIGLLINKRISNKYEPIINDSNYIENINNKTNEISILVHNKEQLEACKLYDINIITDNKELLDKNIVYKIPRGTINYNDNYQRCLVTDYGSMITYKGNSSDYYLNVCNKYTLSEVSKYQNKVCLSVEYKIEDMPYFNNNVEVLIYGNIDLMLMKYCILKDLVNKDKVCNICSNNKEYYLLDRNNEKYKIVNNKDNHITTIMSNRKVNLINRIKEFKNKGITNFRIDLLDENKEEIIKILKEVIKENE